MTFYNPEIIGNIMQGQWIQIFPLFGSVNFCNTLSHYKFGRALPSRISTEEAKLLFIGLPFLKPINGCG